MAAAPAELKQKVKDILRRDLKLGPDYKIEDGLPLFNSDADLDSLDMLLLVSSIEREFGFRIPNENIGETVFQSVNTLADYIEANKKNGGAAPKSNVQTISTDPLDRLPHAAPFKFVSKLISLSANDLAIGTWTVKGDEAFFAGHFPGNPIVPGVLIAEALAQLSGLIVPASKERSGGKLAHVDVRFEKAVAPPAEITLRSKLVRALGNLQQFDVSAEVNGETVARGSLAINKTDGAQ